MTSRRNLPAIFSPVHRQRLRGRSHTRNRMVSSCWRCVIGSSAIRSGILLGTFRGGMCLAASSCRG